MYYFTQTFLSSYLNHQVKLGPHSAALLHATYVTASGLRSKMTSAFGISFSEIWQHPIGVETAKVSKPKYTTKWQPHKESSICFKGYHLKQFQKKQKTLLLIC